MIAYIMNTSIGIHLFATYTEACEFRDGFSYPSACCEKICAVKIPEDYELAQSQMGDYNIFDAAGRCESLGGFFINSRGNFAVCGANLELKYASAEDEIKVLEAERAEITNKIEELKMDESANQVMIY